MYHLKYLHTVGFDVFILYLFFFCMLSASVYIVSILHCLDVIETVFKTENLMPPFFVIIHIQCC